jgi:hypothetical protein
MTTGRVGQLATGLKDSISVYDFRVSFAILILPYDRNA